MLERVTESGLQLRIPNQLVAEVIALYVLSTRDVDPKGMHTDWKKEITGGIYAYIKKGMYDPMDMHSMFQELGVYAYRMFMGELTPDDKIEKRWNWDEKTQALLKSFYDKRYELLESMGREGANFDSSSQRYMEILGIAPHISQKNIIPR